MTGLASEYALQLREGGVTVRSCGQDQAHDGGDTLPRAQTACKEPVLAPERNRPDPGLDPVVVDCDLSVEQVVYQLRWPSKHGSLAIAIRNGRRLWADAYRTNAARTPPDATYRQ